MEYFVMANHPAEHIPAIPMVANDEGDIQFFETQGDAIAAAESNDFCNAYGYEVFKLGNGE